MRWVPLSVQLSVLISLGIDRGNGTNCVRIVPYSAVQFSAYTIYKKVSFQYALGFDGFSTKCLLGIRRLYLKDQMTLEHFDG